MNDSKVTENSVGTEDGVTVSIDNIDEVTRRFNVAMEVCSSASYRKVELPYIHRAIQYHEDYQEDLSTDGRLISFIQGEVPGVESLTFRRYSLTVVINRMFDWTDVQSGILEAIRAEVWGELNVLPHEEGVRADFTCCGRPVRTSLEDWGEKLWP